MAMPGSVKSVDVRSNRTLAAGTRFGRITVERMGSRYGTIQYVWCLCDCGNKTMPQKSQLISGATKSCGCLAEENQKKYLKKLKKSYTMYFFPARKIK